MSRMVCNSYFNFTRIAPNSLLAGHGEMYRTDMTSSSSGTHSCHVTDIRPVPAPQYYQCRQVYRPPVVWLRLVAASPVVPPRWWWRHHDDRYIQCEHLGECNVCAFLLLWSFVFNTTIVNLHRDSVAFSECQEALYFNNYFQLIILQELLLTDNEPFAKPTGLIFFTSTTTLPPGNPCGRDAGVSSSHISCSIPSICSVIVSSPPTYQLQFINNTITDNVIKLGMLLRDIPYLHLKCVEVLSDDEAISNKKFTFRSGILQPIVDSSLQS